MVNPITKEYKFPRGFILDERSLLAIQIDLKDRLSKIGILTDLEFEVTRLDGHKYTTINLSEILQKESNKNERKITALVISHFRKADLQYRLRFGNRQSDIEGVFLSVTGSKGDLVENLFNETKSYLENDVVTLSSHPLRARFTAIAMLMIVLLFTAIWTFKFSSNIRMVLSPDSIQVLKDTGTVHSKLNFLIDKEALLRTEDNALRDILIFMEVMVAGIACYVIWKSNMENWGVANWLYPRNVIVIGREVSQYQNILGIRGNIFWVIIWGFFFTFFGYILAKLFP